MAVLRSCFLMLLILSCSACSTAKPKDYTIRQRVEVRDGVRSVWGVQITPGAYRFKPEITRDQIQVIENKHDRDITDLMTWSIGGYLQWLDIAFKPGLGDFGTGNSVTVRIARSALDGDDLPDNPLWTISTDLNELSERQLFWGPGVSDPDVVHRRLEALAAPKTDDESEYVRSNYGGEERYNLARGMYWTMTWEQVAYVYRNASMHLKMWMVFDLIGGQQARFEGMDQRQIIALLGRPDNNEAPRPGDGLIYTGEGYVSDHMSAVILVFDEAGRFAWISYAN